VDAGTQWCFIIERDDDSVKRLTSIGQFMVGSPTMSWPSSSLAVSDFSAGSTSEFAQNLEKP
jgi:hypothetical protein